MTNSKKLVHFYEFKKTSQDGNFWVEKVGRVWGKEDEW